MDRHVQRRERGVTMTNDEIRTVREAAVSYRPMWKKHQIDLMRKTGTATIHAEMSLNPRRGGFTEGDGVI